MELAAPDFAQSVDRKNHLRGATLVCFRHPSLDKLNHEGTDFSNQTNEESCMNLAFRYLNHEI